MITQPDASDKLSLPDRLLDTLRRSSPPINRTHLRRLLAVQNNRLGETLQQLEAKGRIKRTPQGWSC